MVLAVRMKRPSILEKPWCPWVIERGAGPENSHVLVDLFVGDAEIVRMPAPRRFAQLVVNLLCGVIRKVLSFAQALGEFNINPAIAFGVSRRVHSLLNMNHTPLVRAADSFLFFLQTASENHVGVVRGLGHKEVHNTEEFKFFEGLLCELRIGKRIQWIETARPQPLEFSTMNGLHDSH